MDQQRSQMKLAVLTFRTSVGLAIADEIAPLSTPATMLVVRYSSVYVLSLIHI